MFWYSRCKIAKPIGAGSVAEEFFDIVSNLSASIGVSKIGILSDRVASYDLLDSFADVVYRVVVHDTSVELDSMGSFTFISHIFNVTIWIILGLIFVVTSVFCSVYYNIVLAHLDRKRKNRFIADEIFRLLATSVNQGRTRMQSPKSTGFKLK